MSGQSEWRPEFTVRVTIAGVLAIVAALFITAFFVFPEEREQIKFVATVIGGAAALYSAYHAGAALRINIHQNRQKRAYEILDSFSTSDAAQVRTLIRDSMDGSVPPNQAYDKIQADPAMHSKVSMLLGALEDMSIAIQTQYADEVVLFRSLETSTVKFFDSLKGYIDGVRQRHSPRYYVELELLVGAWREARSVVTRRKLR